MDPLSAHTPDSDGDEDKKSLMALTVTELISILRTAYRTVDYDRVEEVLVDKETKLKAEIGVLSEKLEMEKLERMNAEEQMKKYKEQFEKGKKAEERCEKLLQAVKKNNDFSDGNTVTELRNKNRKLDNEKRRAESEIESWKRKCEELNERLLMVEKGAKSSMNRYTHVEIRGNAEDLSGVPRNTDQAVSTEAIDIMEMNEVVIRGHESGNTLADFSPSHRKTEFVNLESDDAGSDEVNAQLETKDTQSDIEDGHDDRSIRQQYDTHYQHRGSHIQVQDSSGKSFRYNRPEKQVPSHGHCDDWKNRVWKKIVMEQKAEEVAKTNKRNRGKKQTPHHTSGLKTQASKKAKMDMDNSHTQPKRRQRGPTCMKRVGLSEEGTKIPVEFDDDLKAVGENGPTFSSYVGYIVRSKISIAYPSWKTVPDNEKNAVWDDILQHFEISANERLRHRVLMQADERWRDFKSSLARNYIRGVKRGEHPKDTYRYVSEEAWEQFLQRREDAQYKAISERNQGLAKKNVYKHYMSRGGYSALERRMLEERVQTTQEAAASDANVDIPPVQRPTRQQKWKAARMKKGSYINPEVAAVAERIDQLEEEATQGLFVNPKGTDILEIAIGGRVRGAPKGLSRKDVFGSTSRTQFSSGEGMISRAEHEAALEKARAEQEATTQKKFEEMEARITASMLMMGRNTGSQLSHVAEQISVSPVVTSTKECGSS